MNDYSHKLNEIMIRKHTLYVLQGFNGIFSELNINCKKLMNTKIEENIEAIYKINIRKEITNIIAKLSSGDIFYCFMEELLYLNMKNVLGNIEIYDYKIVVIDFNIFGKIYPGFKNSYDNKEIVRKFESFGDSDIIQYIYSYMAIIDDVCVIQYNSIESKDIEYINYFDNKINISINSINELTEENIISFDISNEKLTSWLSKFLLSDEQSVYVSKERYEENAVLNYMLKCLSALGYKIYTVKSDNKKISFDESKYLNILKRKDPKYEFKYLDIYINPVVGNEKVKISQSQIINDIVSNSLKSQRQEHFRDIFVTAPTGSGKSVMFQIPAIYLAEEHDLLTIIISPLIGLMNDQVNNIKDMTDLGATINSDYTPFEKDEILEKVKNYEKSILYLSPESLLSNSVVSNLIGNRKIGLVVVDEAHTVATWGKSFRPDYWYLGEYIHRLRGSRGDYNFPIATFTATATYGGTDDMYSDIVNSLNMTPISYIGNVKRDDISFKIRKLEKKNDYQREKQISVINTLNGLISKEEKTLVYFPFKSLIREVKTEIPNEIKNQIGIYHGSLDKEEKTATYDEFCSGGINAVFATKAFGMGIDIDDIKNIYHYAPTGNITDYIQEIGRAARKEGVLGYAITDYYKEDYRYINQLYGMSRIKDFEIVGVLKKILQLYKKYKTRNFLVAPQEFSHIFNVSSDDEVDSKLKTVLLVIKKDFENNNKINYVPLIFKPRSMFTKGYFLINDNYINYLRKHFLIKYFTLFKTKEDLKKQDGNMITTYLGDVYEFDFRKMWEERYKDISFGAFKYKFYNDELDEIKLQENIIPEMLLDIEIINGDFSSALIEIKNIFKATKNILDDFRISNKYYTYNQFAERIVQDIDYVTDINNAKMISESMLGMINKVETKGFYDKSFLSYNSQTQKFIIKNVYYNRKMDYLSNSLQKKICNIKKLNQKTFLIPNKNRGNMKKNNFLICVQILELFGLCKYQIKSGDRPELFIRVNSETAILNIINNPNYTSETLHLVNRRHEESVEIMKKFFGELETDMERWNFVESYFIGRDVLQ